MIRTTMVGYIEGCSTILLMGVAVPLKYLASNDLMVKIMGPIHGTLFLLYVGILFLGISKTWSRDAFVIGFIAAIIPGGPFWFESKLQAGRWPVTQIEDR